jgi:hypothetical protein
MPDSWDWSLWDYAPNFTFPDNSAAFGQKTFIKTWSAFEDQQSGQLLSPQHQIINSLILTISLVRRDWIKFYYARCALGMIYRVFAWPTDLNSCGSGRKEEVEQANSGEIFMATTNEPQKFCVAWLPRTRCSCLSGFFCRHDFI